MVAAALLTIERWLWLASCILSAVLATRLFLIKLSRTYRFFLASLAFTVVRTVVMWPLDIKSGAYWTFWISTEPVTWLFSTLVVLELCSLIFKEYRGIQLLSRRAVYAGLGASLLISVALLVPTWRHSNEPFLSTSRFLMVERGVDSTLVILLLILLVLLALLPIPLSRNVVVHSTLYAAFFMASSLGIFIVNITSFQRYGDMISTVLMGFSLLCLVAWIALLSPQGETKIADIPKLVPADYEQRLVEHLSSINTTLLRARSKVDSAPKS